ncbi:MAG: hypothetical protein KY475_26015 [Planctomycetes bacterium]|nr:hypothetical protein [Planctomycetota bacterium]
MAQQSTTIFLQQLGYQSPVLLACLAGVTASLVFLRRATGPAMLCLLGCGLFLVTILAVTGGNAILIHLQMSGDWPPERYMLTMRIVSFVAAVIRAVCLALLIAAVFIGRSSKGAKSF